MRKNIFNLFTKRIPFVYLLAAILAIFLIWFSFLYFKFWSSYQFYETINKNNLADSICDITITTTSILNVLVFIIITLYVARKQKYMSIYTIKKQKDLTVAQFKINIVNELRININNLDLWKSCSYSKFQLYMISFGATYLQIFFNIKKDDPKYESLLIIIKKNAMDPHITEDVIKDFLQTKDDFLNLLLWDIHKEITNEAL